MERTDSWGELIRVIEEKKRKRGGVANKRILADRFIYRMKVRVSANGEQTACEIESFFTSLVDIPNLHKFGSTACEEVGLEEGIEVHREHCKG